MYKIQSQQVDLFVTEEHRMYVQRRNKLFFELLPAREIYGKRVSYKKDAEWIGEDVESVTIDAIMVNNGGRHIGSKQLLPAFKIPVRTYLIDIQKKNRNGRSAFTYCWYYEYHQTQYAGGNMFDRRSDAFGRIRSLGSR